MTCVIYYNKMYLFVCSVYLLLATTFGSNIIGSDICIKVPDGYIADPESCDSYIKCQKQNPMYLSCPDGLNFNANVRYPNFPCGYPEDVPCSGRAKSSLPQPTADCPRKNGYFPSPAASKLDCGRYRVCNAGKATEMSCSTGLAFNPVTSKCDWPDQVSSCSADDYLGFSCPPGTIDISGNPIITNHKYNDACYTFISCKNGQARLLSCDIGFAFNAISGHCETADMVPCTAENRAL